MAANINLHQPRVDLAHAERDDENSQGEGTTSDSQASAQPDTTVAAPSEQQGQSGDGAGSEAGSQDTSTPPSPPAEPDAPKPNFARYGVGDTVIMGRPDYGRAYAVSNNRFEPPEPAERTLTADAKPMPKPGSVNPSALTPIPMPKPGSGMSPTSTAAPLTTPTTSPSPTTNAPRVGGEAVAAPAASAATSEPTDSALAFERGMADLTLGDPLNKELIARYEQEHPGANLVEHGNATADHLVATYGEARLNDMAKLHQALAGVRDDYNNALTAAEARGPSFDNTAFWKSPPPSSGDGGSEAPIFDNAAFTRWYIEQDGLSNRAFAANYAYGGVGTAMHQQGDGTNPIETTVLSGGTSVIVHQRMETSSEGGTTINVPRFAAPGLFILGGPTSAIELHDPKAVWFDPTLGFVTSETNVVVKDDFADKYMMVIIVTAVTAGAGSLGLLPTAATFGGGTSGAILAGAANSVITSTLVTAAQGGDITFKGMFQAALTGGFMGGLTSLSGYRDFSNLGLDTTTNTVTNYALRALSITGHATLQGALRELVGGRFRDGFTESLVQGLAGEITRVLNNDIAGRLTRGEITAEQGRFLNEMSRATGSALRAAANPDNPGYAFAQDYLQQLLGPGTTVPEVRGTALDDDGNVMPGVVDTTEPLEQQQRALQARLEEQGLSSAEVNRITQNYFAPQFMARDRFPGGVGTPVFDDNGNLNAGVVDNRQTEAQQRQEIAARLIAQGVLPAEALRLASQTTLITITPQEIRQTRIDALTRTYTQQGVTPDRARQIAIGDVDGFGSESYLDSTIDYSAANREALARMLGVSPDTIIDVASRPNEVTRIINEARRVRSILDDEALQRFGNDPVALSAAFIQNDITATQYRALLVDVTFATPERMANAQTLVNRVLGFVQAGGGAALMAAGYGASSTGVGLPLGIASIGLGADQVAAGLNTMIDGVPVKTLLEQGLIASGMSEGQAALAAGLLSISPVVLERSLANPAVRAYLVERLGPMFGDLPPEKLIGLQRVFGDNVMVRNGGSFAIGDAAEDVVAQELVKLGYKDIVAIKSTNGQGIDIVARSSDGSIMIFEVKGSMSNRFSSLPTNQADFDAFLRRTLDSATSETGGGFNAQARANANAIRDAMRNNVPIHAVRVNVSLGPEVIASKPSISFVPWNWKK